MTLTHGSLFAGIGGFDLGFERAGIKTVWQVEIDEYCRRVLARHWPEVARFRDVRECTALPRVDIITGGFPCQDISNCGLRAGLEGARSGLWREMSRIIHDLRPQFVIVENVAALLDRGMGDVLADLAGIGYDAEWERIPARAFGAPHIRERLWIAAYPSEQWRIREARDGKLRHVFSGGSLQAFRNSHLWQDAPQPELCRMDDGIPDRVVRHEHLGNALLPQIAEWIGRRIVAVSGISQLAEKGEE